MGAKPGFLRNLRIKRVALVENGANHDVATGDGAHIMLYKSADVVEKDGPNMDQIHVDRIIGAKKGDLDASERNDLPDSAFAAVWTDASGNKQRKLPIHDAGHLAAARGRIDQADIPANVKAEARRKIDAATKHKENAVKKTLMEKMLALFDQPDVEKRKAEAAEIIKAFPPDDGDEDDAAAKLKAKMEAKAKKSVHKADDASCDCEDCVAKSAVTKSAEVVEMQKKIDAQTEENAKLRKSVEDATTAVNVEKNLRLDREMVDVLKSFKHTPLKIEGADNDIAKFRKMKDADPASFDRMIELLRAQDNAADMNKSFGNVGSGASGGSGGSAWAQIESLATKIMEKGTEGMTIEKAINHVLANPANQKLVNQYRTEQQ